MNILTKTEKLEIIKYQVKENNISAYSIAEKTTLTQAGVGKILNGGVKNPHESTINELWNFINNYLLGRENPQNYHIEHVNPKINIVQEEDKREDLYKKVISLMEEKNELISENVKLKLLLERNNIKI